MENRKQFTFYRSYYDAIRVLPKRDQAAVLLAVCAYALDGEEPDLNGTASAIFALILPTLDAGRRKAEGGKKGSPSKDSIKIPERCKKDTVKEKEKEKSAPSSPLSSPLSSSPDPIISPPYNPPNTPAKEKKKENPPTCVLTNTAPQGAEIEKAQGVMFHPPTVEMVAAYCTERGNRVDAQTFVEFYASKGWMIGKNRMKDWRAAVRTWEKGEKGRSGPQSARPGFQTSNPFLDLLNERRKEHGDDL